MTWWKLLIIIVTFIVAVVVGWILGRILAKRWAFPFSQKKLTSHKQNAGKAASLTLGNDPLYSFIKEHQSRYIAQKAQWETEKNGATINITRTREGNGGQIEVDLTSQGDLSSDVAAKIKRDLQVQIQKAETDAWVDAEKSARDTAERINKKLEIQISRAEMTAWNKVKRESKAKALAQSAVNNERARIEAEKLSREDAEKRSKEKSEMQAKEQAERYRLKLQKEKEQAAKEIREKTERDARETQKAKERAAREAQEKIERELKEAQKARQHAVQDKEKARLDKERLAEEKAERVAKELEKEKKTREAREKAAWLAAEARREREEKARLATEQQAKEKAEQLAKEKAEQFAREKAERESKEELERAAREATAVARREAEETHLAKEEQEKARLAAEQQAKESEEKLAKAKAEREAQEKAASVEQAKLAAEKLVPEQLRLTHQEAISSSYTHILEEISANIKIAAAPPNAKPEAFFSEIWDTKSSEIGALPVDLQYELGEAYTDIRLANNIVWLIKELGANSPDFAENYSKLCLKITERLTAISERIKTA
jgi:hypothetical protein